MATKTKVGLLVVITAGVAAALIQSRPFASEELPVEVLGLWTTAAVKYQDGAFALRPDTLEFHTVEGRVDAHPITRIEKDSRNRGALYTIHFEAGGHVQSFSFVYDPPPVEIIRLEHQPRIAWRKGPSS